jgi:hypothetical protein
MERETVYRNLEAIKEAVIHHQEILVDLNDENILTVVPNLVWEKADHQLKDRSRFIISKTITFSPSVFEEDQGLQDTFFALFNQFVTYFNRRKMAPITELLHDLILNEMQKDGSHHDYTSDQTGT